MKFFQGIIKIKFGKIISFEQKPGFVRLDADGNTNLYNNHWAMPGFIDSHCHISGIGAKLLQPDLHQARCQEDCIGLLEKKIFIRDDWLCGYGWNQELWKDKKLPDKKILDEYYPDLPVCLLRIDGHAAWINSKALALAGITRTTPNPQGGIIVQSKSGEPTGILIDNAMEPVMKMLPEYDEKQIENFILAGIDECLKNGITEVHDMDVPEKVARVYEKLKQQKKLKLMVNVFLKAQNGEWLRYFKNPNSSGNLNINGLKFFLDGALGSGGAALLNKYRDNPRSKGILLMNEKKFKQLAKMGLENNWQIAVHAIGDSANRAACDVFHSLYKQGFKNNTLRVEHSQILQPDEIKIMSECGIIASVQPVHCTSDVRMAERKLYKNDLKNAYRWKSLLDAGIKIIAGSDSPVESLNPFYGMDAFVNRIPVDYNNAWYPYERISLDEALKAYTNYGGNIEQALNESFIVVDRDVNEENASSLKDTEVKAVYYRGKILI